MLSVCIWWKGARESVRGRERDKEIEREETENQLERGTASRKFQKESNVAIMYCK